jgi:hypothetical protein
MANPNNTNWTENQDYDDKFASLPSFDSATLEYDDSDTPFDGVTLAGETKIKVNRTDWT